jgi:hypothetical protein
MNSSSCPVFEEHREAGAWTQALTRFAREPALPVPLLGNRRAAAAAARLHSSALLRAPSPGRRVVLASAGSAASSAIPAIAAAFGATRIVQTWDEAARVLASEEPELTYIAVVGLTADFGENDIARLQQATWDLAGTLDIEAHIGFLMAPDLTGLAWMVAKTLAWPWRTAPENYSRNLFAATSSVKIPHADEVILKPEAVFDSLGSRLRNDRVGLLSLLSHGRDDVLHLHDAAICANTSGKLDPVPGENLPTCAYTGCCFRDEVAPGHLIPADQVLADVIFANSCMGFRVRDGLFPERYLLVHGFHRGSAVGYIGSSALLNSMDKLNLLAAEALRAGASLGQSVSLVNDHLRYELSSTPRFTLMGAPWLTMPGVPLADNDRPLAGFLDARDIGMAKAASAARDAILTGQVPEAGAHFFVSSRTRPAARMIARREPVRLAEGDAFDRAAIRIGEAIENLTDLPLLGFRESRQGNLLVTLRDQLTATAKALAEALELAQPVQARRRVTRMSQALARAEAELAAALHRRGVTSWFEWEELWMEVLRLRSAGTAERPCGACQRELDLLLAEHPVFRRIRRRVLACPRCGIVEDIDPRGDVRLIEVSASPAWIKGTEQSIRLRIAPDPQLTAPADVQVGIYSRNADKLMVEVPPPAAFTLVPGQELTLDFAVKVLSSGDYLHQDYLKGFVVSKGTIAYSSCPIWYRPSDWRQEL